MLQGCSNSQPAPGAPSPSISPPQLSKSADMAGSADYAYEPAEAESSGGYAVAGGLPAGVEARKVVYSADFSIATEDFGAAMRRLEQKIAVNGSYIQQSDHRAATEYSAAYASMTIRVPAAMYGDFKSFLTDLAELTSSTEHGEDVTAQYFDTEARLRVLQAQEARIKTFIAESKDLDEIFKIERELTRISTEIEQLTTVKNRLDNLSSYATVYVEVREITEHESIEPPNFGERVVHALQGSLKNTVIVTQSLILFILCIWPVLVLIAIVLLLHKFGKRPKRGNKPLPPSAPQKHEEKHE